MGGGTLQRSLTESGGKPEIDGSVLLAVYDTRDEVVARVRDDIYAREGVWDVDNVCSQQSHVFSPGEGRVLTLFLFSCFRCKSSRSRRRSGRPCKVLCIGRIAVQGHH